MDLLRVDFGRAQVLRQLQFAAGFGAAEHKGDRFADEVGNRMGAGFGRGARGEGQQLVGQAARPQHGFFGFLERLDHGGRQTVVGLKEREVAEQDGQQVVEVVGDAAGQKGQRLETGGAVLLGFEAATFGDVAQHHHITAKAAGFSGIKKGRAGQLEQHRIAVGRVETAGSFNRTGHRLVAQLVEQVEHLARMVFGFEPQHPADRLAEHLFFGFAEQGQGRFVGAGDLAARGGEDHPFKNAGERHFELDVGALTRGPRRHLGLRGGQRRRW